MSVARNTLLWMSENKWMKENIPHLWFVKKAVKKFMPGEKADDALEATRKFSEKKIPAVFTKLGENITSAADASAVRDHYLGLIDKIHSSGLDVEISIKLTQLGFDLSVEETRKNFKELASKVEVKLGNALFIDMEGSAYTEKTVEFYKAVRSENPNAGLCVQAYLYRTEKDLADLLKEKSNIRLVKGAYKEPAEIAFPEKIKVDENYFALSRILMKAAKENNSRAIFATHDEVLIKKIIAESGNIGLKPDQLEFQMLYGIKPAFQKKLAAEGYRIRVLISYGDSWYPWYVRRLAERPANVWFVLKNMF